MEKPIASFSWKVYVVTLLLGTQVCKQDCQQIHWPCIYGAVRCLPTDQGSHGLQSLWAQGKSLYKGTTGSCDRSSLAYVLIPQNSAIVKIGIQ